jgi:hypothetical protein
MPPGGGFVIKPTILDNVERWFAKSDRAALTGLLRDLRSGKNLTDLAKEYGVVKNEKEALHLRRDWFNESRSGWWQQAQPIEPLMREALIKATEVARKRGLPVVPYWVCSGYDESAPVEMSVAASKHQVTLLIHAPSAPGWAGRRGMVADKSILLLTRAGRGRVKTETARVSRR